MTPVRRLDHVAILVRDSEQALHFYRDRLGLSVAWREEIDVPPVRLTYLSTGNAYLQLVEPLDGETALSAWLDERGEGLHHICFGVDDAEATARRLSDPGHDVNLGSGRGRVSAFVETSAGSGVRIECTAFDHSLDVDATPGWIEPSLRVG